MKSTKRRAHKRRKAIKVGNALKIIKGQAKAIVSLKQQVADLEDTVVEIARRLPKLGPKPEAAA